MWRLILRAIKVDKGFAREERVERVKRDREKHRMADSRHGGDSERQMEKWNGHGNVRAARNGHLHVLDPSAIVLETTRIAGPRSGTSVGGNSVALSADRTRRGPLPTCRLAISLPLRLGLADLAGDRLHLLPRSGCWMATIAYDSCAFYSCCTTHSVLGNNMNSTGQVEERVCDLYRR